MTQPEALRLAQWLERDGANCQQHVDAASELRRLRFKCDALLEALKDIERSTHDTMTATLARAAIAKAEGNT